MILLNVTVDMVIKGLSCIEVTMIKNSDVDCAGINVYCALSICLILLIVFFRIILLVVYLSESF